MKIILPPVEIIEKFLGKQEIKFENLRKFTYIYHFENNGELLLYNVLTRELVVLSEEEKKAFYKLDFSKDFMKHLVENWFFVEENTDDYNIFKNADDFYRFYGKNLPFNKKSHFVVFTTTDCNARCFYCFESNNKKRSMSEKTANDVADYMIKHSVSNQRIKLSWFGGEPLYNYKVIEIITEKFREHKIEFYSSMASNAYLFDEVLIKKAINDWKLEFIQITLDGTEDVYNKVKAYIYKDTGISPFVKVMNNIECLLKKGVAVSIRLNIDMHNFEDIEKLFNSLIEKFSKYNDKLNIYVVPLFETCGKTATERTDEIRKKLMQKATELDKRAKAKGLYFRNSLYHYRRPNFCMSDDNYATTILPGGELGKCEHYLDDKFYGSIYSDKIDYDMLDRFREKADYGEKCRTCPLQPRCLYLLVCQNVKRICDDFMKELKFSETEDQMLSEYNRYKQKQNKKDFENECN